MPNKEIYYDGNLQFIAKRRLSYRVLKLIVFYKVLNYWFDLFYEI